MTVIPVDVSIKTLSIETKNLEKTADMFPTDISAADPLFLYTQLIDSSIGIISKFNLGSISSNKSDIYNSNVYLGKSDFIYTQFGSPDLSDSDNSSLIFNTFHKTINTVDSNGRPTILSRIAASTLKSILSWDSAGNSYSYPFQVGKILNSTEIYIVDSDSMEIVSGIVDVLYNTPGTYSWTCPEGITSVNVVCVGGGGGGSTGGGAGGAGGGGGGLGWKNNIPVTPGQTYTVVVGAGGYAGINANDPGGNGGNSYFINESTVKGSGGTGASNALTGGAGGDYVGDGGGNGGSSKNSSVNDATGGGGAGGYTGNGGDAGDIDANNAQPGSGGGGGGGGAGGTSDAAGAGGGVGVYGKGTDGSPGSYGGANGSPGTGGSGGEDGSASPGSASRPSTGGAYGGGGGGAEFLGENGPGGSGAVRITSGVLLYPDSAYDSDISNFIYPYSNSIDLDSSVSFSILDSYNPVSLGEKILNIKELKTVKDFYSFSGATGQPSEITVSINYMKDSYYSSYSTSSYNNSDIILFTENSNNIVLSKEIKNKIPFKISKDIAQYSGVLSNSVKINYIIALDQELGYFNRNGRENFELLTKYNDPRLVQEPTIVEGVSGPVQSWF